jgi:hypothetical protein
MVINKVIIYNLEIYTVDFDLKVLKIEDKDPDLDNKDKNEKENIYKKLMKVNLFNLVS